MEFARGCYMFTVGDAIRYMNAMRNAVGDKLVNPNSIYSGKTGHQRFARECGYALNDFDEAGREEIVHGSYSSIYVRCCNLRPILDAKEWINLLLSELKRVE